MVIWWGGLRLLQTLIIENIWELWAHFLCVKVWTNGQYIKKLARRVLFYFPFLFLFLKKTNNHLVVINYWERSHCFWIAFHCKVTDRIWWVKTGDGKKDINITGPVPLMVAAGHQHHERLVFASPPGFSAPSGGESAPRIQQCE